MPNDTPGGRLLARRYRLSSQVGHGGMGTVWQAHDEVLGRDVAVKEVILPHGLTDDERTIQYKRTFREARTAARLGHPGVVTVYDVVEEDGRPWIVMELIKARSLDQVIKQGGPLDPERAARLGRQMLAALHAAHEAGVLHRDVKPSNVLLAAHDRPVLTDFGIATAQGDATLTQTGLVMGSPAYIAPERARGRTSGPASDLWSLGVTLYAMVEGRSPYERSEPMASLVAIISEEVPPPPHGGPLTPVILGLLRKDPDERMDAHEAGRLLDDIVRQVSADTEHTRPVRPADLTVADALPPTPTEPAGEAHVITPRAGLRPDSRRTIIIVLVVAAVLVLGLVATAIAMAASGDDKKAGVTSSPVPSSPQKVVASSPSRPSPSARVIPNGFRLHKDVTGFSIAVPNNWRGPDKRSYSASSVFFESPDGRSYIQVDQTSSPSSSALRDWNEQAAGTAFQDYKRIKIAPVTEGGPVVDPKGDKAADWEFTFTRDGDRLHGLNRGFVMNGHGYAIFLVAPEADWTRIRADLDPIYRFFTAAG